MVISSDFMRSTVSVCDGHKEGQSEATGQIHRPSRALPWHSDNGIWGL